MDAGRQSDFTQSLDLGLSLSGPWAVRRRSHILESSRALEANNGKPAPQDPAPLAASPAPAPQAGAASPPPPPILASAGGETQAGAAPPAVPPTAVALPRAGGSAIAAVGETIPVVPVPPEEKQPYAPDTVIVTLRKADASLAKELAQLRADAGVQSYRALSNIPIEIWTLAKGSNVLDVVAKHASSPLLESIEPDYLVSLNAIPNDPSFNQLWGLHNTGQNGGVVDADIDAPEAWNLQTGNPNLVIGVLDTGVDYTHQDLAGNVWINPGEIANDGIDNDGNGYVDDIRGWDFAYNDNDPMDVHSHGTHVAGTIAARGNNSLGVTGVAWNAKIMPLKFLNDSGSGFVSNAVLALNYALNKGVRITNNSWGGGPYSASLYAAISAANTAGSLFVAAAGNFGLNADTNPMYPAAYNLANIISVASTTRTDTRSSFSNYGLTSVDLGAPGSDIYSTIPGNGYGWKSGTSMAAPHVAGGAALLWSHNPTLTSQQVKATLMNTGDPLPSLAGVTVSGKRLNLNNALASLPLSVVTVVATDASAAETPTGAPPNPGQFTLSRTFPTTGSLTVNVSLSGTASNGVDYTTLSTPITFGPGVTAVTVPLTVIDDLLVEGTETAILTIVPGAGYTVGAASTATVTIADNERPIVTVTASDASAAETLSGSPANPGQFTLSRTGVPTGTLTVAVSLTGTASNGVDYTTISTPITFGPGITAVNVPLTVIDDLLIEGTETAILTIVPGASYTVGAASSAGVQIIDNDFVSSTIILNPFDRGWYDNSGFHNPSNPNYIVGDSFGAYRNFFAFNLPVFSAPILSAQLALNTYDYNSAAASENYVLQEVTTPVSTLVAGGTGQTAIFTDLGDGVVYGTRNYVNADDYQTRTINLNPAAINALTAKSGQAFALGGQLTTLDLISNTEYVFGFSNTFAPSDVQLILNLGAPPPVISVVASDASAAETLAGTTPNPGRFTLSRSGGATANPLSVTVSLGGTASNGADYLPIPTTVNFAAGSLVADVDLIVVDDALVEGSETASLTILAGNGYAIGTAASATVTIQDNDSVPNTIILSAVDTGWYDQTGFHSPTNPNYIVGDYFNLYRNFFAFNLPTFTAPITGAQLAINTFDYDSPALNENYQVLEVTTPVQTLLAGGSGKTAIYADLGDGVAYGVRSYFNNDDNQVRIIDLNSAAVSALTAKSGQAFAFGGLLTSLDALSNSEYVFGFSNSVGPLDVRLILNTGAPLPSVSVVASDPSAAETLAGAPPNPGEFTLSRSGPLTSPLTVNLAMSGTATNGIDYGFLSGPITFAAGVASLPLSLSVIDDLLVEGTETATLNVLAGLGYSVGSAASATVSILDNDTVSSTTVVNAVDTGWYNKSGFHDPSNTNYIAGDSFDLYRNFFAFNLPVLTAPIISAQLAINTYDYNSANALETYQLQDVSTAIPNLTAGGSGLTAIYADLGDGITFGGRNYINTDDYLIRTIDLNAAAINAITARSGQAFALGGQVTSLDTVSNFEYVFGFSNSVVPTDVRLILNTGTALPLVSVVATDAAAAETPTGASPNPGQFTLFRTGSTANALSVNVAMGGTATNGADYNAITGPITFAAGAASVVVPLNVIDDLLVEGSETATLTVTAGNGYSLGAGSSATVTIEDNDGLNQLKTATLSPTSSQADPIIDFRSAATTAATAADEVQPVPISDSLFEKIPLLTDNRLLIEKSAGKVYLNLDGSRANPTNLIDSLNKSLTPLPEYLFAT